MPKTQLDRIEELLLQLVNDPGPEWIPVAEACTWLGVNRTTLYRWRMSQGLAWTNINNRHVMYDKKQIQRLLFENSTYKYSNELHETSTVSSPQGAGKKAPARRMTKAERRERSRNLLTELHFWEKEKQTPDQQKNL